MFILYAAELAWYKELVKDKKGILTMPQRVATHAAVSNSADVIKVDASGLQCPGPIMKVASKIAELNEGSIIEVTSTDRGFKSDIVHGAKRQAILFWI